MIQDFLTQLTKEGTKLSVKFVCFMICQIVSICYLCTETTEYFLDRFYYSTWNWTILSRRRNNSPKLEKYGDQQLQERTSRWISARGTPQHFSQLCYFNLIYCWLNSDLLPAILLYQDFDITKIGIDCSFLLQSFLLDIWGTLWAKLPKNILDTVGSLVMTFWEASDMSLNTISS